MKCTPEMNVRAQTILADIVGLHSQTGQPVGSKAIVEASQLQLSPASIRNVMQGLEKQGLLTHPHTSAGRVPTEEGFRYYATQMLEVNDVPTEIKAKIDAQVNSGKDVTTIIKEVSDTISDLTGCASLITAPKRESDPLSDVKFMRLGGDNVMVVMVTASGEIENRIIQVPAFIDTDELSKASKDLKNIIAGQTLDEIRTEMLTNLAEQKGRVNEMIDQMMGAASEWGQPTIADGTMVVAGSTNLFQYPEMVREKLQNLIKMFEEKRLLMSLMEEVKHGEGVQIYIGKDSEVSTTGNCSIIASSYGNKNKNIIGTLGVIGPMRMDYKQTIGVVNYTSKLLSRVLEQEK